MGAVKKKIRLKKSIHEVIYQDPLIIRIESTSGEFVEVEDAEAKARQAEIAHQWRRLIVGAAFTIPLLALSMARGAAP